MRLAEVLGITNWYLGLYGGNIRHMGTMEKKWETTIMGLCRDNIGYLGFFGFRVEGVVPLRV